jgi:phytoene synthase
MTSPGSLRQFAVLFSGSPERPLLEAVYAFEAELRRIVRGRAHEAAHARLQWWRAELDRLAAGNPSHPLGEALLPLRGRRGVDLALLHEMLVAADLDLARLTYVSWQELDAYLFRSAGSVQTLIAATLAGERGLAAPEHEFARQLGSAFRQAEMLAELDADLGQGRLYAPMEPLHAAGIDPQSFAQGERGPAAAAFLAEWHGRVRARIAALPGLLTEREHRTAQRQGLVLAALLARRLDRPAGSYSSRSEPFPLATLWTAWRTALRHT